MKSSSKKNVVIVGRPNVGKSSLFNRLIGRKRALVLDVAGVTRDRIVEPAKWWVGGKEVSLNIIDTGGLGDGQFKQEIANQVNTALEEASVVLFVMDIRAGLTVADEEVFNELRKTGLTNSVPMIGVLNKADHDSHDESIHQFYQFGLEVLMPIAAEHNIGIDDLKDTIVSLLSHDEDDQFDEVTSIHDDAEQNLEPNFEPSEEVPLETLMKALDDPSAEPLAKDRRPPRLPSIAIIGQPNVGKSTLLNAICGEKRAIVSPIAGTTVDSIDTMLNWHGKDYVIIDTAGIRRKNKTEQGIEVLSVVQTRKTLERADLALLLIDSEKGV